jgi:hypothetical protein
MSYVAIIEQDEPKDDAAVVYVSIHKENPNERLMPITERVLMTLLYNHGAKYRHKLKAWRMPYERSRAFEEALRRECQRVRRLQPWKHP